MMTVAEHRLESIKYVIITENGFTISCENLDSAIVGVTNLFHYVNSVRFIDLVAKEDHIFKSRHEFEKHVGVSVKLH